MLLLLVTTAKKTYSPRDCAPVTRPAQYTAGISAAVLLLPFPSCVLPSQSSRQERPGYPRPLSSCCRVAILRWGVPAGRSSHIPWVQGPYSLFIIVVIISDRTASISC